MKRICIACLLLFCLLFPPAPAPVRAESRAVPAPRPMLGIFDATNEVWNGSAEQVDNNLKPDGWTITGKVIGYPYNFQPPFGQPLLKYTDPGPLCRGENFFMGGESFSLVDQAQQSMPLMDEEIADIDAGNMVADLSAWLGGLGSQPDYALVSAQFLDGSNAVLKTMTLPAVSPADRGNASKLMYRALDNVDVPGGARSYRLTLMLWNPDFVPGYSSFNYAIADNIKFNLHQKTFPDSFGYNLLPNGDAEDTPDCARDATQLGDQLAVIPLPGGWNVKQGSMTVVEYGIDGGWPTVAQAERKPGLLFFAGGPESQTSVAEYTVNLSMPAWMTASGRVVYKASGIFGGYDAQNDRSYLRYIFKDKNSRIIAFHDLGNVTAADRGNQTGLLARDDYQFLPAGTTQIIFQLIMERESTGGGYNDGYADRLSFELLPPPGPETWWHYMPLLTRPGAPVQPGKLAFKNASNDTIVSIAVDGVELMPGYNYVLPQGNTLEVDVANGDHTYVAWSGTWTSDTHQIWPRYKMTGTFKKTDARLEIPLAYTIYDELTRQKTSAEWDGFFYDSGAIMHEVAFCFYPNGKYRFYQDGSQKGSGPYALEAWGPLYDSFRVTDSTTYYIGKLNHVKEDVEFTMENGPSSWKLITYALQLQSNCPSSPPITLDDPASQEK